METDLEIRKLIELIRKRLAFRVLIKDLIEVVLLAASLFLVVICSFMISDWLGIILLCFSVSALFFWIHKAEKFRRPSLEAAALFLDEALNTRNRVVAWLSLAEIGDLSSEDDEKRKFLTRQIEPLIKEEAPEKLVSLKQDRRTGGFAVLSLLLVLIGIYLLGTVFEGVEVFRREGVKEIEKILAEEALPEELKEELLELNERLQDPEVSEEEIEEAIEKAEEELEESKEELQELGKQQEEKRQEEEKQQQEQRKKEQKEELAPEQKKEQEKEKQEQQKSDQKQKKEDKKEKNNNKKKSGQKGKKSNSSSDSEKGEAGGEKGSGESGQSGKGEKEQKKPSSGKGGSGKGKPEKQDQKKESKKDGKGEGQGQGGKSGGQKGQKSGDPQKEAGPEGAKQEKSETGDGKKQDSANRIKKTLDKLKKEMSKKSEKGKKKQEKKDSKGSAGKSGDKKKEEKKGDGKKEEQKENGKGGGKKPEKEEQGKKDQAKGSPNPQGASGTPSKGKSGIKGNKKREDTDFGKDEEFKEIRIKEKKDKADSRFTGKEKKLVEGEGGGKYKTELRGARLSEPDGVRKKSSQRIPLEYRELLD